MNEMRPIILKLLRNLGSRAEVETYLKEFSGQDSKKFAIIKVGGAVVRDELDSLATSLTFLQQVGLTPIVVLGAGPQLDEALAEKGIVSRRVDGLRVTDKQTLDVARKVFQTQALTLVDALERMGTRARPIIGTVFEAELLDFDRFGYVGEVTEVDLDPIYACIRAGALPILACLGETESGQIVNINADVAANKLAVAGQPYKIVFLTSTGGLLDQHGNILPSINLAEDYDQLMNQPWVHSGMRLKLQEIKELLDELPQSSSVSITKPDQLARELFTHKGSGTLVRRGEEVSLFTTMEGVDQGRVRDLLENCFQRRLADGYFDDKPFYRIYLTESYRACAILTKPADIPYLDKFGVTQKAQGEGIGGSVWSRMRQENPVLFWRSRTANPINAWYFQQSDGAYKTGEWTVFWYGLKEYEAIKECVDRALAMPPTLYAHHAVGGDD